MCKKNNGIVNEKFLFHGSRSCQAFDIYGSEEGFDMRFSGEGMWGLAIYFAENASYSDSYANENGDGIKEMFVAKVLTGDSCKYSSDKTLRLPPLKSSQACFHHERYDTVEGETKGSKVYMTYSNDKAYPAYLIVYCPHYHTCPLQPSSPQQYPSSSWIYFTMRSNPLSLTLPHGTSTTSQ